jgi:hypothetical protein
LESKNPRLPGDNFQYVGVGFAEGMAEAIRIDHVLIGTDGN